MRRTALKQHQPIALMFPFRELEMIPPLVVPVEARNCVILRARLLVAVLICSLACLWLGVARAQTYESPSHESGIAVTQSPMGRPFVGNAEASHLALSMVDRSEIEATSLPNSAVQSANPDSTDQHSAEKVLIPAESQGSEYASLAALASVPSSSLLNAVNGNDADHAHSSSAASGNKTLVYQLGGLNFVINGLPNSFSLSSGGSDPTGAR